MNFPFIGSLFKTISSLISEAIPDPDLRKKVELALEKNKAQVINGLLGFFTGMNAGQVQINIADAKSGNKFQSGWRPYIGWTCGFALTYHFLIHPLFIWIAVLNGVHEDNLPPDLDISALYPLMLGMLGLSGLRSGEKIVQGTGKVPNFLTPKKTEAE